jgi:hypothetical protein
MQIFGLRTGTPKKFADLQYWNDNEPKNLRIYDLRTNKSLLAHL